MDYINVIKKLSLSILLAVVVTGCSSKPELEANAEEPRLPLPAVEGNKELSIRVDDPWEGFNRRMYYFNAKADEYVLLPVVRGYKAITPDIVETGISNVFNNLGEVTTFVNSVLQFKLGVAAETLGRFAINSTVGIAGIFDVATHIGLDEQNEDFGQTLGRWGVSPGPYLVLPFLGPSSLRDATGNLVDMAIYNEAIDQLDMKDDEKLLLGLIKAIDARATTPFRYHASDSAFEYDKVRTLYTRYRQLLVER